MKQFLLPNTIVLTVIAWFVVSSKGSLVDDHNKIGQRDSSEAIRQHPNEAIKNIREIKRAIAQRPGVRLRPHQRIRPGSPLFDLTSKTRREINVVRDLHHPNHDINKELLKKVERYHNKEISNAKGQKRYPQNDISTFLDEIRRSESFAMGVDKDRRTDAVESVLRSHFPELLNCRIINPFPPPDDHISCCEKTELCECPRPMGVCSLNEEEDDDADKEDTEVETSGYSNFVERK